MPSKKRKYNARFPAGRIKKIMQTDEEVGKVAQAVPVIISRTLELFVESLLTKAMEITNAKNAKTLSPSHMKQCILSENRFDFLKDLVKNIPDINNEDNTENSTTPTATANNSTSSSPTTPAIIGNSPNYEITSPSKSIPPPLTAVPHCSNQIIKEVPNKTTPHLSTPPPPLTPTYHLSPLPINTSYSANFYTEQQQNTTPPSSSTTPPITFSSHIPPSRPSSVIQFSSNNGPPPSQPIFHIGIKKPDDPIKTTPEIPPLIPIMQHSDINLYNFSTNNDNLCTDDDYDN